MSDPTPVTGELTLEGVEWLPAAEGSGLLRVLGRGGPEGVLPLLLARGPDGEARFTSLPDARPGFGRAAGAWRGAYVLPAALLGAELWLEWGDGARLRVPAPGEAPPGAPAEPEAGGQVIDRAVLAERRARRAESAEREQARAAREARAAAQGLELRLAQVTAERDALLARGDEAARVAELEQRAEAQRAALVGARESVARLRGQVGEWRLRLRTSEIARTSAAVQVAVLEGERAAAAAARAEVGGLRRELAALRERAEAAEAALAAERARAEAAAEALAGARAELAEARRAAAERAARLEALASEAAELRRRLDEEHEARSRAAVAAEAARADAATAAARAHTEAVAQAALAAELARERAARQALATALDAERARAAQATPDAAALAALRTALAAAVSERDALRAAAAPPPPTSTSPPPAAPPPAPHAADRRAASPADVAERLRAQAAAAASAAPRPAAGDTLARLDAAASALRSRPPAPAAPPASASARPLREALVRLARVDPRTAGRLLVALLPAQAAVTRAALSYDLTVRGIGTFAVTLAGGQAAVAPLERRRSRRVAAFHLVGDPLALAELLAGRPRRIGRLAGPVRVAGRRRRLAPLAALPAATLSLADAVRAGVRLEPELVLPAIPHAVDPAWTRGHTFTVALRIGEETWRVSARDGAPLAVGRSAAGAPPAATVTLSPAGFAALLAEQPAPPGDRPVVRGDRAVVSILDGWLTRARRG